MKAISDSQVHVQEEPCMHFILQFCLLVRMVLTGYFIAVITKQNMLFTLILL